MMTLGVAGHAREVAVHRAALQECRDIQLVYHADCAAVLKEKIDGLVVLHVDDKSHWIGTALAAGLPVMATHPVPEFADSRPSKKRSENSGGRPLGLNDPGWIPAFAGMTGTFAGKTETFAGKTETGSTARSTRPKVDSQTASKVCVLSLGRHTRFCSALVRPGVAHYSLELSFNSASFDCMDRETICNQAALDMCDLLLGAWGPVDVLYSRMRNFFHPSRMEDVSVALLRMRNGVEGSVALFDVTGGSAALRIRLYAADEIVDASWPWAWEADDLTAYYRNFIACIQGCAQPLLGLGQVAESYRLLEWMRASARQDAVLSRREVK